MNKHITVQFVSRFLILFCVFSLSISPTTTVAEGCAEGTYCFLAPLPASDQFCSEEDMADGLCNELSEDFSLGNYVNGFFRIGIALAGVLAVIMFVVGGITYMMSAVVGQKESAKGMMGNALLGLLLALGSYAILNTINPTLTQFNLFGGENETIGGGGNSSGTNTPGQINESCQLSQIACSNSSCGQYLNTINTASGGDADMAKALKAVMIVESSCNISAGSSAGACGLFQLLPSTANDFKTGCTTANITCDWLKNPNNASQSACIAKNYLTNLKGQPNVNNDWRNTFAGYNGGNQAIQTSDSCPDEQSCINGGSVLKWECPWDDTAHTVPNTGFEETREYVKKVNHCYTNPGF